MADTKSTVPDEPINFGDVTNNPSSSTSKFSVFRKDDKTDVNSYDIYVLAAWVLGIAAFIYVGLALLRVFYSNDCTDNSGVKDVWEYSKVILNSIVSLVLGLYFGSNKVKSDK